MVNDDIITKIQSFSSIICHIYDDEKATFDELKDYFDANPIIDDGMHGRVWILIGNDDNTYKAFMVAQSENIYEEIKADIEAMYNTKYKEIKDKNYNWSEDVEIRYNLDFIRSPQVAESFYKETFLYPDGKYKYRNQYLYRFLKKKFTDLIFYEVIIDEYLGIKQDTKENNSFSIAYELGKDYLAEAKLALESNAIFWNYYKSGVGKRAYLYYKKNINNAEKV